MHIHTPATAATAPIIPPLMPQPRFILSLVERPLLLGVGLVGPGRDVVVSVILEVVDGIKNPLPVLAGNDKSDTSFRYMGGQGVD